VDLLGPVYGAELATLRRRALTVVVPNVRLNPNDFVEGFGLVAVEGAADGGIVLASDLDGISAAVRDGETGFLLPPGDPDAWARKIRELASWSDQERADFVARARRAVAQHYSWERVARRTVAFLTGQGFSAEVPAFGSEWRR
jgi:glycosyltransferase involved in cell wall biosynthesis